MIDGTSRGLKNEFEFFFLSRDAGRGRILYILLILFKKRIHVYNLTTPLVFY